MFFNADWDYIGDYWALYSKVQKDSYKGFSLADVYWNDKGKEAIKNLTTLNVIYKYNANDGSGDYDGLPCTVNENAQSFTGLSISIDLAQE